VYSSANVAAKLSDEGFRLSRRRLSNLILAGHVQPPPMVSAVYVWREQDISHLRRVLESLDGFPNGRSK